MLGGDDFRAGGEVELGLAGVAEPDAVTGADLVVGGQVDGNGLMDAVAGGAPVAGGGGPDGAVRVGGAEGGESAGEAGRGCAGEVGERVQGVSGCGDEHVVPGAVVAVADLRGEPGGQDGKHLGEGEVVEMIVRGRAVTERTEAAEQVQSSVVQDQETLVFKGCSP